MYKTIPFLLFAVCLITFYTVFSSYYFVEATQMSQDTNILGERIYVPVSKGTENVEHTDIYVWDNIMFDFWAQRLDNGQINFAMNELYVLNGGSVGLLWTDVKEGNVVTAGPKHFAKMKRDVYIYIAEINRTPVEKYWGKMTIFVKWDSPQPFVSSGFADTIRRVITFDFPGTPLAIRLIIAMPIFVAAAFVLTTWLRGWIPFLGGG